MICARECFACANQSLTRLHVARAQISKCMIFRHSRLPAVEFFSLVARTCFVSRPPRSSLVCHPHAPLLRETQPLALAPRRCYLASFVLPRNPRRLPSSFAISPLRALPRPPFPSLRARDFFAHDINARLRAIYVNERVARRVDSRALESYFV